MHQNSKSALLYAFARVLADGSTVRLECHRCLETNCDYWLGFRNNEQMTDSSPTSDVIYERLVPQEETEDRDWFVAMSQQRAVEYRVAGTYYEREWGSAFWEQVVQALSSREAKAYALFKESRKRYALLDLVWHTHEGHQMRFAQSGSDNYHDALAKFVHRYQGETRFQDHSLDGGPGDREITNVEFVPFMLASQPVRALANQLKERVENNFASVTRDELLEFVGQLSSMCDNAV